MKRFWLPLLAVGSTLAVSGLTSCASMPAGEISEAPVAAQADGAFSPQSEQAASSTAANTETSATERVSRPQLIKKARLTLAVDSMEEGLAQVRDIMQQQEGYLLSLEDEGNRQRRLNFQMRVPQDSLEATLDALTELGTVRSRSITTEDVSRQLVDLGARLSNARKSEAALQQLMERSGDISDVLEVSRELSNVRQSIEQMTAQQQSLQTQVSYSTITLSLESAIAQAPSKPAFSRQLASSWNAATNSVGDFTTDLLQLGLWLLAYSPYLAIVICGGVLINRVRRVTR
ncbi:MAG: DUF4349 domain-containing protein [Cyanobacteria bacterium J06627_32]